MSENSIPAPPEDLASRIAQQTLARRGADYADEVRRLLDAALDVIREHGTGSRPRVADIVAAAGLSNDAFYRHFPSRDALVAALLEDGTERLAGYLRHQMDKEASAEEQVGRWVEGMLSQTRKEIAAPTLAVLWNGGSVGTSPPHRRQLVAGVVAARTLRRSGLLRPGALRLVGLPRDPGQGRRIPLGGADADAA